MDKIEDIRRRARRGQPAAQIARGLHVSEPTVREYRDMEDLSVRPRPRQGPQFPTPEGFRGTIGAWPIADSRQWRKQRHAATRVCVRLRDEGHYEGGYSTVQRYVHWKREQMALERDRRDASGYLLLRWLPGECQADFGEADFRVRGVTLGDSYLAASFPHPSVGLTQVLWGETPGCVCQGLRGVFEFVGGVPVRAAFGNATEVGRRLGTEIRVSRTSKLFASHYGLDHGFTNPRSGKGKGSVENMAGARRRATFVLVPSFHDVRKLNGRLLEDSLDLSDRRHYRLSVPRLELSGDDRAALPPSRRRRSAAVRWEARTRRASKRGRGGACGIHRYSVGPAMTGREVDGRPRRLRRHVRRPHDRGVLATYEREWGSVPTSSADPTLRLKLLCMHPGGWRDLVVRDSLPGEPAAFLDAEDAAGLSADLRVLRDAIGRSGLGAAGEGMVRSRAGCRRSPRSRGAA